MFSGQLPKRFHLPELLPAHRVDRLLNVQSREFRYRLRLQIESLPQVFLLLARDSVWPNRGLPILGKASMLLRAHVLGITNTHDSVSVGHRWHAVGDVSRTSVPESCIQRHLDSYYCRSVAPPSSTRPLLTAIFCQAQQVAGVCDPVQRSR